MPESRAEIGDLWRTISREVHDRFRQAFKEYDLPFMTLILLRHISQEPGVTVNELARRSGTVKSHVSKMVDMLGRQGYVQKRTDPADQRLLRIHLTETAEASIKEMEDRTRAVWSEVMDDVPKSQLDDVVRGLRILVAALERSKT